MSNNTLLERNSAKPLYQQLEEIFNANLDSKIWTPDMMIPSENELSVMYGVSRMTARNVVTKFVQESLMVRIPGKGTFIAEPKFEARSLSYAGIREQLEKKGYEVSTTVLSVSEIKGDKSLMDSFSHLKKPYFYLIKRLRFVKSLPFSIHTSYIPVEMFPNLPSFNLEEEQLCKILSDEYGIIPYKTEETLESTATTKKEAELLNIKKGHPLLLLSDTIYDKNEQAYEFSKVLFRGEKIKINLKFNFYSPT